MMTSTWHNYNTQLQLLNIHMELSILMLPFLIPLIFYLSRWCLRFIHLKFCATSENWQVLDFFEPNREWVVPKDRGESRDQLGGALSAGECPGPVKSWLLSRPERSSADPGRKSPKQPFRGGESGDFLSRNRKYMVENTRTIDDFSHEMPPSTS